MFIHLVCFVNREYHPVSGSALWRFLVVFPELGGFKVGFGGGFPGWNRERM